ncbi:hypothetical protein NQ315_002483 [Exocentrus adspersus]|uniref:Fibronectin type-III domain-containing protein n=1 Tax=Exocentrus adspersus TaxID=1586481 RepID=A0AAV8VL57_9CUCU|nr:hypothetical protein NQ315_002483 [Exocentrus adspersus]
MTNTMVIKKILPKLLMVLFMILCSTSGQDECVPTSVQHIDILSNTTLVWDLDAFETCHVTNFNVDIWGNGEEEFHLNVTDRFLDVSFLGICELWNFAITPFSYEVSGASSTLSTYVHLPPDADLSLSYVTYSFPSGYISIDWDLTNRSLGDCSLKYRLTLHDEDRDTMEDIYVSNTSINLYDMLPCTQYETLLRAVNMAYPMIGGPLRTMRIRLGARVPNAPTLKALDIQATSFNITVELEGEKNKCPLRTIRVNGGVYFDVSVSLYELESAEFLNVEVKDLLPNRMYFFNVSIKNNGGWSAVTPLAVQTLDFSPNK